MGLTIEIDRKKMVPRFKTCANGAAAKVIAALVGYGLREDDLAAAMDDIPHILTEALWGLLAHIETCPGDYMAIKGKPEMMIAVMLDGYRPEKKISVIRVIREITNLGLKEAKEFVEITVPINGGKPQAAKVKESISEEEANAIKQKLEEAGGIVSLL